MGRGFSALAISTLTPFWSMGVMTMKMISSTSMTSAMGVTLISAIGPGIFILMAITSSPERHA